MVLIDLVLDRPRAVIAVMVCSTLGVASAAVLPSIWPAAFAPLNAVEIDTDPENMLPEDEAVRLFHNRMKAEFSLHDMIVVGIVNETHPDGVFNPRSLARIHELTDHAKSLRWPAAADSARLEGVVPIDVLSLATVDSIEPAGAGAVRFSWMMAEPPATPEQGREIHRRAARMPLFSGTLFSEDGKAAAIYLPITSKNVSYRVASMLQDKIATFAGQERYFISGMPVAQDTFGVEMFKQMAISAPLSMLVIFLLLFYFFRHLLLVLTPMVIAMVSVITTMGLLVISGQAIHIMSSMIPIFIMPIAVLDSVHILSEFHDRYPETRDRRATIRQVMAALFTPMFFTTITTSAGFASLALTPIPPVQVFGVFVALGVAVAWVWTMLFIPASVMMISPRSLEGFGLTKGSSVADSPLTRLLGWCGRTSVRRARAILVATILAAGLAAIGISRIRINDNPVKWFEPRHPIRQAADVLGEKLGGAYMAYLVLEADEGDAAVDAQRGVLLERIRTALAELSVASDTVLEAVTARVREVSGNVATRTALIEGLEAWAQERYFETSDTEGWDQVLRVLDEERQRGEVFKDPATLRYVADLQRHLSANPVVGKSSSLADLVKTVHRDLLGGEQEAFRIPDSAPAVAQSLLAFQGSHRAHDLWHLTTPDFRRANLWIQLESGDNRDMVTVVASVEEYLAARPPPRSLGHSWFGLTYLNVVWQQRMVRGMLLAFLGGFAVVLIMMVMLFRSLLWGLLSVIPLTVSIAAIYGTLGLIGRDYDMPVAVLSALSLGLAVDYAIHFLVRSRQLCDERGGWSGAVVAVFAEPSQAIARNVVIVGAGFLPLLAAPLVPYQTVGVFMAAILITAGAASLLILPALITLLERRLFPPPREGRP